MPNQILGTRHLDTDVYTLALERTAVTLDRFDHVVVSWSGGKDSTCVLEVALEVAKSDPKYARHLPMRVVFSDEEAIPVETEEFVRRTAARGEVTLEWYCLPVKHRNACSRRSPWWWPWAPESEALWCRPLPAEAITTLPGFSIWPAEARMSWPDMTGLLAPPARGNTAMLMGIRAQESRTRQRAVRRRGLDNYLVNYQAGTSAGNFWKSYPIYDWLAPDVWTAAKINDWDYNRAYDRLEMAGVTHAAQRCSPAFGEEPIRQLDVYAKCFPEVWQRMAERVPGVSAAVRYARTELYGFGGALPDKPAGMSWPEFILHYLAKFRPGDAAEIGGRMQNLINRHYRNGSIPIVPSTVCPTSGLSWHWLLMLAVRGDFKGRRYAEVPFDAEGRPQAGYWRRYADELAAIIAAGTFAELGHPGKPPADPYALIPDYARGTE